MKKTILFFSFLTVALFDLTGQLNVHEIFGNGMVLQRNEPIKIWGEADLGAKVNVFFNQKTTTVKANEYGRWLATLPMMAAGEGYTLTVKSKKETIEFKDVLIGDVWICSGQSNMEMTVEDSNNAAAEIAAASDNLIRHYKVMHGHSKDPEQKINAGKWEAPSPETVGEFTAVGYFFAKKLRQHTGIPIGLVNSTWGGSRIETWMSSKGLNYKNPKREVGKAIALAHLAQKRKIDQLRLKFPDVSEVGKGIVGTDTLWAAADFDDSKWTTLKVPGIWESQGYDGFDGIAWYRKTFELTAAEAKESVQIAPGKIDDGDISFVNGNRVGGLAGQWSVERKYKVSSKYLKTGKNVIAVRVEDTGGGGGIHGEGSSVFLKTNAQKRSLVGDWKFKLDHFSFSSELVNPHQIPTLCYNKMIYPINNFVAKGVIWYQGESNAESIKDAAEYATVFKNMIRQWRADREKENLPFLFVQLANFLEMPTQPRESNWAVLRESQTKALELPNTAQAVIIDIGAADDVHPKNKQDVGLRLALAARNLVYCDSSLIFESPRFKKQKISGKKIILSFENIGDGLHLNGGGDAVEGFAIAGADRRFVWAKAILKNNQIEVWNDKISKPKYIRYAWAENPGALNLYNSAGLPATPFRTDD